MNTITRILTVAAFITAASAASAERGPQFTASSSLKKAPIVQDQTKGPTMAKHSGRHPHSNSEITSNVIADSSMSMAKKEMDMKQMSTKSYQ